VRPSRVVSTSPPDPSSASGLVSFLVLVAKGGDR
jgi:hypothetical protein